VGVLGLDVLLSVGLLEILSVASVKVDYELVCVQVFLCQILGVVVEVG